MKKKLIIFSFILFFKIFSYSESDFLMFESAFKDISNKTQDFLPESSTLLSFQPDAFIGNFFPSIPPRFTAGISASVTTVDTRFVADDFTAMINDIISLVPDDYSPNVKFSIPQRIFLPNAAAQIRIGGFFLPFDFGVFGVTTTDNLIKNITFDDFSMDLAYTSAGGDIRYAIFEGRNILPKLSVGAGYIYSKYTFGMDLDKTLFSNEYGAAKLTGDINLKLESHTIFAQIQASKKILFLTPSIGLKAYSTIFNSNLDWEISSKYTFLDLTKKDSYSSSNDLSKPLVQLFAGCGIQLWHLQLSVCGAYNFTSEQFSASAAVNFKM